MKETYRPDSRGLPKEQPLDPAMLAKEEAWLEAVERQPPLRRGLSYLKRGGPGYLLGALTLGGGSASASLLAGAAFGYELLWVPWTGMAIGMVMLLAVAHQTLSTGMRPFEAMRIYAGPIFAYGWAIGALLSSVVWHFAQYALASSVLVDMAAAAGWATTRPAMGAVVLVWSVVTAQMFGSGSRWTKGFAI